MALVIGPTSNKGMSATKSHYGGYPAGRREEVTDDLVPITPAGDPYADRTGGWPTDGFDWTREDPVAAASSGRWWDDVYKDRDRSRKERGERTHHRDYEGYPSPPTTRHGGSTRASVTSSPSSREGYLTPPQTIRSGTSKHRREYQSMSSLVEDGRPSSQARQERERDQEQGKEDGTSRSSRSRRHPDLDAYRYDYASPSGVSGRSQRSQLVSAQQPPSPQAPPTPPTVIIPPRASSSKYPEYEFSTSRRERSRPSRSQTYTPTDAISRREREPQEPAPIIIQQPPSPYESYDPYDPNLRKRTRMRSVKSPSIVVQQQQPVIAPSYPSPEPYTSWGSSHPPIIIPAPQEPVVIPRRKRSPTVVLPPQPETINILPPRSPTVIPAPQPVIIPPARPIVVPSPQPTIIPVPPQPVPMPSPEPIAVPMYPSPPPVIVPRAPSPQIIVPTSESPPVIVQPSSRSRRRATRPIVPSTSVQSQAPVMIPPTMHKSSTTPGYYQEKRSRRKEASSQDWYGSPEVFVPPRPSQQPTTIVPPPPEKSFSKSRHRRYNSEPRYPAEYPAQPSIVINPHPDDAWETPQRTVQPTSGWKGFLNTLSNAVNKR
ncbi:hypothetical protein ONZ45_g7724 [Pleurotus djamor]|nr:hypothetical protein ONZ45_g7724 [Pleurotus djamor]